jgi:hypothetical protein
MHQIKVNKDQRLHGRYAYPFPFIRGAIRRKNLGDRKSREEKQGGEWCSDLEEGHFESNSLALACR